MKNNETSVSVNAELNMKDVKKELDIFFNTTVKKVKTEVDSSKLINALKDFKIKDLVPKIEGHKGTVLLCRCQTLDKYIIKGGGEIYDCAMIFT